MRFSEYINRYREVFNELKCRADFGYTNKQIAEFSGFEASKISRFLTGKRDLNAGEFFYLLERMPEKFQQKFWHQLDFPQSTLFALNAAIEEMDLTTLAILMQSIGAEIEYRDRERK